MTPPQGPAVLMTADAIGGVWTYALDLAGGLAEAGVSTRLAVLGPSPSDDQRRDAGAVPGISLIETGLPVDWLADRPAEILKAGAALRDLARALKVDVVHLNSPALAAGGDWSAPVLGACHSCLATWWSTVREGSMPEDFRWRTHALWKGMTACNALIAPSHAFAEATRRAYDAPRPFVIHNGRAAWAGDDRTARQRCVVTAGRLWDDGKNVAVLDAAAGRIDAPVHAAGPQQGPSGQHLALDHARPLGRLPQQAVRRWLRQAQVFASSALYEPFGLSVLEAAQAGCALVLSDIPTFRELWDGAAVLVAPDDVDGWTVALQDLLDDPVRCRRLGEAARARSARYSIRAMTTGVLDVYRFLRPGLPILAEAAA